MNTCNSCMLYHLLMISRENFTQTYSLSPILGFHCCHGLCFPASVPTQGSRPLEALVGLAIFQDPWASHQKFLVWLQASQSSSAQHIGTPHSHHHVSEPFLSPDLCLQHSHPSGLWPRVPCWGPLWLSSLLLYRLLYLCGLGLLSVQVCVYFSNLFKLFLSSLLTRLSALPWTH